MDSFILNQSIWQVDPLLVLIVEIQFPLIGFGSFSLSYLQKLLKVMVYFILLLPIIKGNKQHIDLDAYQFFPAYDKPDSLTIDSVVIELV